MLRTFWAKFGKKGNNFVVQSAGEPHDPGDPGAFPWVPRGRSGPPLASGEVVWSPLDPPWNMEQGWEDTPHANTLKGGGEGGVQHGLLRALFGG